MTEDEIVKKAGDIMRKRAMATFNRKFKTKAERSEEMRRVRGFGVKKLSTKVID